MKLLWEIQTEKVQEQQTMLTCIRTEKTTTNSMKSSHIVTSYDIVQLNT